MSLTPFNDEVPVYHREKRKRISISLVHHCVIVYFGKKVLTEGNAGCGTKNECRGTECQQSDNQNK